MGETNNSYKIYASKDYVDERALPGGATEYQQLVTDGEGNKVWEDRLAYFDIKEEIVPITTIEGNQYEFPLDSNVTAMVSGSEYVAVLDDVTYVCVAEPASVDGTAIVFIGNAAGAGGSNNNMPFVFMQAEVDGSLYSQVIFMESSTHKFSVFSGEVKRISKAFLPDDDVVVGYANSSSYNFYILDPTLGATAIELYNAVKDGKQAILRVSVYDTRVCYMGLGMTVYEGKNVALFCGINTDASLSSLPSIRYLVIVEMNGEYVPMTITESRVDFSFVAKTTTSNVDGTANYFSNKNYFGKNSLIINSNTTGSTKQFAINVDDSGKLTTTNTEDSTPVTMMPEIPVTTEDNGKVLGVVEGSIDLVTLTATDVGAEPTITTLDVTKGGTGYNTIADTTYTTARYRASALVNAETTPTVNGVINWQYE